MTDKRIINVLIIICFLFILLAGYLTYIQLFRAEKISQNPYNQRQWAYETDIDRGIIYDSKGTVLAKSEDGKREYPYKNLYCHLIGYNSQTYGKSGIESKYNKFLLGQYGINPNIITSGKKSGYDLTLTIDNDLQKQASALLGNRSGSIVAINPKTGAILTMLSKPDFDPNDEQLNDKWQSLVDNQNSPLFSRATGGLYAPGSTFKIITLSEALANGYENRIFNDTGSIKIGTHEFPNENDKQYGNIGLDRALQVSSNVVFCTIGSELGSKLLCERAELFGFNKDLDFDVDSAKSVFPTNNFGKEKSAALAIGQGEVLATPLQMAMVASAIANNGNLMKPYLVDNITTKGGISVFSQKPTLMSQPTTYTISNQIKQMMVNTVKYGTGSSAAISGIDVAGKTGTAENEMTIKQQGKAHTWFVAFAPANDPQIAIAVMMEYSGGSGSGNCGPVVRQLISSYLNH